MASDADAAATKVRAKLAVAKTLEDDIAARYADGVQRYRGGDATQPFDGDPLAMLYEELLDGITYCREERQRPGGLRTAHWERRLREMALELRFALSGRTPAA